MGQNELKKIERQLAQEQSSGPSLLLFVIILMFSLFIYWSTQAELDMVTRGEGTLIAAADNQVVQASEGGVIIRRLVSENDLVYENQVLFEIDPIDASAEFEQANQRYQSLEIKKIRLEAEIGQTNFILYPAMKEENELVSKVEADFFKARSKELFSAVSLIKNRILQAEEKLLSAKAALETELDLREFIDREVALISPLVAQKIEPETRLLELLREQKRNSGAQKNNKFLISETEFAIDELKQQIKIEIEDLQLRSMDELSKVIPEMVELKKVLPKLLQRVSRTKITAPMDGVISQINYKTIGGYVRQGDILLDMVPGNQGVILEGKIAPQDISRISTLDKVQVRLSAYDSSKYGALDGAVTAISPDTVTSDDGTGTTYYAIEVEVTSNLILDNGKIVQLLPGMTGSIDVLSGKRTVFEYFWAPLAKVQELALRD